MQDSRLFAAVPAAVRADVAWAVMAASMVALAVLSLWGIDEPPFWRDEVWSMEVAGRGLGGALELIASTEANMALYYVLLAGWDELGSSEGFIRGLSVLPAVATVPVMFLLARRLYGTTAASITAMTLGLSAVMSRYAQEARAYTLVALLAAIATLLLVRALDRDDRSSWGWYALAAAALVYAQLLAGLLLVAHAVAVWLLHPDRARSRRAALGFGGAFLLCLPLAVVAARGESGQVSWVEPFRPGYLLTAADFYAGGRLLVPVFAVLVALAIWWLVLVLRREGRGPAAFEAALPLLWIAVPTLALIAISVAQPFFVPRYLFAIAPGVALLAGATIARLAAPRLLAGAVAVLAAGLLVIAATRERPADKTEDLRAAARVVAEQARPGDAIAYAPSWSRLGFAYYHERAGGAELLDLDARRSGEEAAGDSVLVEEAPPAVVEDRMRRQRRIWVVGYPGPNRWEIAPDPVGIVGPRVLADEFVRRSHWDNGVTVTLYERR